MAKKAPPRTPADAYHNESDDLRENIRHLRHDIRAIRKEQEQFMATAADLQAAIDGLKTAVTKIQEQIAAMKAQPPLIDQAQLDANTADVKAAGDTLQAL